MARRKLPPPPGDRATTATAEPTPRSRKKLSPEERKARHAERARKHRAKKRAAKTGSSRPGKAKPKPGRKGDAPITEAQYRQLKVLQENPGVTPAEFAKKAWPDAEGWEKKCATGTGPRSDQVRQVKGGAMIISAGAALGKLNKAGLALFKIPSGERSKRFTISAKGEKSLEKSREVYGK